MDVKQQMKVLSRIWGADRDGYVFLPYIDGTANTREKRRGSFHEGRAFKWPAERDAIAAHITEHGHKDDLYFTPALFNAKRRIEQNVDAERTLWADLDPVDPSTLKDLRPTIAWESSPGRYQAVWLLNTERVGASWPSKENHRLTLFIGADPSGWDSTQLLRVPGCTNHKPEHGGNAPGRLLWDNGPRYTWEDFDDLPEVGLTTPGDDLLDEELLNGMDRHEVWARVRMSLTKDVRELIAARGEPEGDRSDRLWQMERELADAGCSLAEIVLLIRGTIWNKYKGRSDELTRLKNEAAKAIAAREDTALEVLEDTPRDEAIHWLSEITSKPLPRPRWLVNNIWTVGGCGFISGAPKSYKSWMALDLAVSVATGSPFLGITEYTCSPTPVLYLQEEDDIRLVMQRMAMVLEGRAPERFWHGRVTLGGESPARGTNGPQRVSWTPPEGDVRIAVHVQTGFVASDPTWQAWLEDVVASQGFGLVIIDTLGTTAGEVDTDRSGEVTNKMLKPLKQIAKQHDCGVAIVHHNKKDQGHTGRAGQQMLGSTALHAWVDCAIYARSKDKDVVVIEREAKLAMDFTLRLRIPHMHESRDGTRQVWEPEIDVTSETLPATPADERPRRRKQDPGYRLRQSMNSAGVATRERMESLGHDVDQLITDGVLHDEGNGRVALSEAYARA